MEKIIVYKCMFASVFLNFESVTAKVFGLMRKLLILFLIFTWLKALTLQSPTFK